MTRQEFIELMCNQPSNIVAFNYCGNVIFKDYHINYVPGELYPPGMTLYTTSSGREVIMQFSINYKKSTLKECLDLLNNVYKKELITERCVY